ncbi:hypothetical protein WJR50_26825 [Catalinimonas sp. 4WD22]
MKKLLLALALLMLTTMGLLLKKLPNRLRKDLIRQETTLLRGK